MENPVEAYALLKEQDIELLLLDIEMEQMSGLELIRNLGNKRPVIIFISAKKDYALEAFELKVADYLLQGAAYKVKATRRRMSPTLASVMDWEVTIRSLA